MSIQFRARTITPTIQAYPPSISGDSSVGWCCGSLDRISSKVECDVARGYFLPGHTARTACPSCPAAFTSNTGSLGACHYYNKQNGFYNIMCSDVYTNFECNDLHQGAEEGLQYTFNPNTTCEYSNHTENTNNILGNCCTQGLTGIISCSIASQTQCSGFWSYPTNGIISCNDSVPCSGVYFTGVDEISPRASLNTLQTSTNYIETLPTNPQIYQGGLYVGIFKPGSPINTKGVTLYGSPFTGNANQYISRGNGAGTSEKSWILIAATDDFFRIPMNSDILPASNMTTSIYDGLYNKQNNEANKASVYSFIDNYTLNGFNDWYIPSQEELAFYFQNIEYGFKLNDQYVKLSESSYMSSTIYDNGIQNFNNKYFLYSQNASRFNYGNVNISPRNISLNIRLFRRIYLNS